jgi:hypothetical protein
MAMPDLERLVRAGDILLTSDVRKLCGTAAKPASRATLIRWRAKYGFPEPVRSIKVGRGKGSQLVELWARPDVRAWLKANPPMTKEIGQP